MRRYTRRYLCPHLVWTARDLVADRWLKAQALPHLFNRFYRVMRPATQAIARRGIGLAIVNDVVALHGSAVEVSSHEGRGSTFTVTLKELSDLAVNEIGFCVGIYWRSVTGSRVPEGMLSANCRLTYVLFSGFAPAYRFDELLARRSADRLPRHTIRLVRVEHNGQSATGVAVIAIVSPDRDNATGFRRAPVHERQPGYQQYFRKRALARQPQRPWWDSELGDDLDSGRFEQHELGPGRDYAERQVDEETERVLDRLEAEFDEKLWWYGDTRRRAKYSPRLGSVHELFAYARKQELDPEEFARRNRERQSEQWLSEQHTRDRRRQQELDADQAEVAAALHTPRRGSRHTDDQDWLATEQVLRARKGLKRLYRDAEPRPLRPREA